MAYLYLNVSNLLANNLLDIDLPGNKIKSEDLHITICYLQEQLSNEEIVQISELTGELVRQTYPPYIITNKLDQFPITKQGYPLILRVISQDLFIFREKLLSIFDSNNIFYDKMYADYNPHITLSYVDSEQEVCHLKFNKSFDFKPDKVRFYSRIKENNLKFQSSFSFKK